MANNSNPTIRCNCCFQTAQFIGNIDFNRCCHDLVFGTKAFPHAGEEVPYFKCKNCGFLFTNYMDDWDEETFSRRIYTPDYGAKVNAPLPGYENAPRNESVPYKQGVRLAKILREARSDIKILDYGAGGNPGDVGLALIDQQFNVVSYEPFFGQANPIPPERFDFVYLIEVIEHLHDLDSSVSQITEHLAEDGLVYISTLLHDRGTKNPLESWYVAPRNGHISIFTFESLCLLFRRFQINIVNTVFGVIGFRRMPAWRSGFFV